MKRTASLADSAHKLPNAFRRLACAVTQGPQPRGKGIPLRISRGAESRRSAEICNRRAHSRNIISPLCNIISPSLLDTIERICYILSHSLSYRGVAQLVARLLWDFVTGCATPPLLEMPKPLKYRRFRGFYSPQKSSPLSGLTTYLTTNRNHAFFRDFSYRGVAQLIARMVWELVCFPSLRKNENAGNR